MMCNLFFSFLALNKFVKCALEAFVNGGDFVEYNEYPHSLFIINVCEKSFVCGGSVLNQELVLTAAHCLEDCVGKQEPKVQVRYGHKKIDRMSKTFLKKFVIHEQYDRFLVSNDIALVRTKERIPLNDNVKRVIIMRYPPNERNAYVAGWGLDEFKKRSGLLKHTKALIQSQQACEENMSFMPKGVFCAGPLSGIGAADRGDSGGALVINGCIQIGIVSFRIPDKTLVAYTNVTYYWDWIHENALALFCS